MIRVASLIPFLLAMDWGRLIERLKYLLKLVRYQIYLKNIETDEKINRHLIEF